jgi:hypothetical protein
MSIYDCMEQQAQMTKFGLKLVYTCYYCQVYVRDIFTIKFSTFAFALDLEPAKKEDDNSLQCVLIQISSFM